MKLTQTETDSLIAFITRVIRASGVISAEKMQAVAQSTVPQSHIIFDCIVLITGIDRVYGVALLRTGKPQHHPGICSGSHSVKLASTFDLTCSTSTQTSTYKKAHTHAVKQANIITGRIWEF